VSSVETSLFGVSLCRVAVVVGIDHIRYFILYVIY
jgi:hypothetical protein